MPRKRYPSDEPGYRRERVERLVREGFSRAAAWGHPKKSTDIPISLPQKICKWQLEGWPVYRTTQRILGKTHGVIIFLDEDGRFDSKAVYSLDQTDDLQAALDKLGCTMPDESPNAGASDVKPDRKNGQKSLRMRTSKKRASRNLRR